MLWLLLESLQLILAVEDIYTCDHSLLPLHTALSQNSVDLISMSSADTYLGATDSG